MERIPGAVPPFNSVAATATAGTLVFLVIVGVVLDSEFKDQCEALFSKYGISTTEAVQLFLYRAVADQTIPVKIGENGDSLSIAVSGLPEAGRIDPKNGLYVLPKDWNNSEDDVYERLV